MDRFSGKVVVVTGGNSGLGLSAAHGFAAEGAHVVIVARDAATIGKAVREIGDRAAGIPCDLSDMAAIRTLAARVRAIHEQVDVLFLNAGVGVNMPFEQTSEALWDQVFNVNLKGLYFTAQEILPMMGAGGAIVANASAAQALAPIGGSAYAASKAGVRSLTRTLAHELVERGIRVNSVSPGPIDDTAIISRSNLPAEMNRTVMEQMAAATPMKRLGRPADVTAAVLFLASGEAGYITGEDILVSGGLGLLT